MGTIKSDEKAIITIVRISSEESAVFKMPIFMMKLADIFSLD